MFGLPGDQLMHALEGLADSGIRFVVTRHEQATTFMADGYARASGRPGVAFVVPGVGVYNAGSGLATAYASSSPVLLVAGQVPSGVIGQAAGALHEVHDQLDLVRPITKSAERVTAVADIPAAIRRAFTAMATGRPRPTEVEIAPDLFARPRPLTLIDPIRVAPGAADEDAVAKAADLLAGAKSPLVVTGGGVVLGDATDALREVAEHLQAPVVDTREGKGGLDSRHPLHLGTMWVNKRLRPASEAADVVLAVGTRFAGIGLAEHQKLVRLDVDPEEIDRQQPATVGFDRPRRAHPGGTARPR